MTILFSNSSPKILKSDIFGPKFSHFCFFTKFYYYTNSKVLISNTTNSFLKFQPKNTQITHFWSQIQAFSLFHDILQLDKFKGADFKYDNNFFKILASKYPKTAFLLKNIQMRHFGPKFQHFCFFTKCCNQINSKVLIANMTTIF